MDYNCKVHVVDMIMGSGKSSAAINYMNANPDKKFLYITPFLSEVMRIKDACPNLGFTQPEAEKGGSKLKDIKKLLSKGENIVSTHSLFRLFTNEIIDICRAMNYTLIMDEVADVVEPYDISSDDMEIILRDLAYVNPDDNLLYWRDDKADYQGEYDDIKSKIDMHSLAMYGSSNRDVVLWLMPVHSFNAFREVYILTYLFSGQIQRYYYDFFKLPYDYLYVEGDKYEDYAFTSEVQCQRIKYDYSKIIHICDNEKLNAIGEMKTDLSKHWFTRNKSNNVVLPQLKKNLFNFFHNIQKSSSDNNIWTTFKDFKKPLSGKGYSKGFLPSNSRATNAYKDRTCVAYCLNKYINTIIKLFFNNRGIETDDDVYATSEMLQFIWRSAVREGNEIWVYIPSSRMRNLLIQWIADNPMSKENQNFSKKLLTK